MKFYRGKFKIQGPARVYIYDSNYKPVIRVLNPRHDIVNHSPDGFAWGYEGSGPAQLAFALLSDHLQDDVHVLAIYQIFKRILIATLPAHEDWKLTPKTIDRYVYICDAMIASTHNHVIDLDQFSSLLNTRR